VRTIRIGDRRVGDGQPCYIVAEAGVNHNGRVELAKKLVATAVGAGVDAVKFQKRSIEGVLIQQALDAPYLSPNSLGATYREHRERLELSEEAYWELVELCRNEGITFLASAWDPKSADFVEALGAPAFKIASADLTNLPLVEHIARKGRPILMSTGMSEMEEIADAVETIRRYHDQLILLHCTSAYPSEYADLHLRVMETLRREFGCLIGYSGHERGLATTEAAVALGACVVERHFTLDRTLPGPDHAASLEPRGLELLVRDIHHIEAALGSAQKRLLPSEIPVRERLAKSVVAAQRIPRGSTITAEHLTLKGPGTGIPPRFLPRLIGVVARQEIPADSLIPKEALEWR
jgi:sialic acid synthase SpsE